MNKNENNNNKIRKVFLDNLPKKGNKHIDWNNSIGCKVDCVYDNFQFQIEIVDYERNTKCHLTIKYEDKEFDIHRSSFIYGILSCLFKNTKFKKSNSKKSSEFKYTIGQRIQNDKCNITIIDREYRLSENNKRKRKYYKYICNICNKEHNFIREDFLIGINLCDHKLINKKDKNTKTNKKNSLIDKTIPKVSTWMIPYFQGGYDEAKKYKPKSNQKIYPICPDCGRIKDKEIMVSSIYKYHSIGCSCGDGISFPNKMAFNLLEQLNIYFQTEYSPDWIGQKRYDNYFIYKGKEYILEMDGGLGHGKDNKMSGQTAEESLAIDDYKDEQAKLNGIEVIRIDCNYESNDRFEYIKNSILNSERLNKLFDLNKINWNTVEVYGYLNLVKLCCDYRKNNPNLEIEDIGKILKINISTVQKWLNKGKEFNWC